MDGCRAWAARYKTRRDQALEAFRLASAALEKADEEAAHSARELAVLGDVKKFHNIPQDHENEMETLMKTLVEGVDVFFSEGWGRDGTEGEQGQAFEDGAKAADTTASGPGGRRRTPAHDGIDSINGANPRVAGHGRSHGVNIANPSARCGQDEKRHWPEKISEFKLPWEELGSNETPTLAEHGRTNSWQEVAHTTSVLPPQLRGRCATMERAQPSRESELYLAGLLCWRSKWLDAAWTKCASRRVGRRRTR